MADFRVIDAAKRVALMARERNLQVAELVAVTWRHAEGPVYYCNSQLDQTLRPEQAAALNAKLGGRPVEMRLMGGSFRSVPKSYDVGDDTVPLELWDGDGAISQLFYDSGEGVRAEVFYYLPQFDELISQFWGHLRAPDSVDPYKFTTKAASGFRSPLLTLPRRAFFTGCQARFGGRIFDPLELAENDCPYDRHLGGSVGNLDPATGQPYRDCPRNTRAACSARLTDSLSYLAFDVVVESKTVSQTKGPNLSASTRGNESNLKRPLRVVYGRRIVRDLDLLAYRAEPNTKHPDKAALSTLWAVSEGSISSQFNHRVNSIWVGYANIQTRNGGLRQSGTGFSQNVPNYSGTAVFYADVFGDWRGVTPDRITGECEVYGRDTVRVYTTRTAYTKQYTTNRAWCLLDMYTNRRYGHGLDWSRFEIQDWIELAAWCDQSVASYDVDGTLLAGPRSTFNADLQDRSAQQQIKDTCNFGRFCLPFHHDGKLRILPLSKVVVDGSTPVFSDYGDDRNICVEQGRPLWSYSIKSDSELPNKIILNFDDEAYHFTERPLTFEDVDQQFRAGLAFGDNTIRVVEKSYGAFGVTNYAEAVRLGNLLLDLGEFDEGGLKNNLRVTFTTWSVLTDVLELHPYKVIKIAIKQLEKFGFEYFRVLKMERQPNLKMKITAQAYPADYYERMENVARTPPQDGQPAATNPGGYSGAQPTGFTFGSVGTRDDEIYFTLLPMELP
jgi:hypothetical protein